MPPSVGGAAPREGGLVRVTYLPEGPSRAILADDAGLMSE